MNARRFSPRDKAPSGMVSATPAVGKANLTPVEPTLPLAIQSGSKLLVTALVSPPLKQH